METAQKCDVVHGRDASSLSSSCCSQVNTSPHVTANVERACGVNIIPSANNIVEESIEQPSFKWLQRFMSTHFLCDVCNNIVSDPVQTLPVVRMICRSCAISHQVSDGTVAELPLGVVRALEEIYEAWTNHKQGSAVNAHVNAPAHAAAAATAASTSWAAENTIAGRRIVRVKRNGGGSVFKTANNPNINYANTGNVNAPDVAAFLQQQRHTIDEDEPKKRMAIDTLEAKEWSELLKNHFVSMRNIQGRSRDSSKALKAEADAKYEEAEYTLALELYSRAIELQPHDRLTRLVTLHGNRSSAYFMAQRYNDCILDCLKVISMEPGNIRMYSRAAKAASIMGDLSRAVEQMESIPEKLMTDALNAEKKKYKCGLELFQRAEETFGTAEGDDVWLMLVAQFSDVIPFRLRYAESLFKQRRFLKAVEALEVVSASRRSPKLCHMLANCLYLSGFEHFEKARAALTDVQQLDEACAKLLKLINLVDEGKQKGNQFFQQKKFAAAAERYTSAISLAENNNQILRILYCNRAAAFKELGRFREGIDDCTKAIQLDSEFSKAYARRARCEQLLSDFASAVRDFKSAIQYDPNDTELVRELRHCEYNLAKESEREKDFYYVLGLSRQCSERDMKLRFRELSMRWHPDKCTSLSAEERLNAERKYKIIGEAYTTLTDPVKRREYDLKLDRERMTRSSGIGRFGTFGGETFRGHASRYRSGPGGFW